MQVVAVGARDAESRRVALLAPILVQPEGARVVDLWRSRATAREASRLVEKYRLEGYSLTSDLAESIQEAAVENEIDLEIAFGLVRAESSFQNTATSPVGAVGLTQLMPSTARWMEPGIPRSALRDPETNLRIGFKYLRYLLKKYDGNENLALVAYNRGPGTVDRALKKGSNPDNGYAAFVKGEKDHGHSLFTE
jgi:soluble lytic murein transglycosylase-like protein